MKNYKELREGNDARYREMQQMIEAANANGGDMSADETKRFDELDAEYRRVQKQIERNHTLMNLAAEDKKTGWVDVGPDAPELRKAPAAKETNQRAPRFGDFRCSDEYIKAYESYLKRGEHTPVAEMRALSEGGTGLGDIIPPTEFHNRMYEILQKMVVLRQISTVMPLGSWKRDIVIERALASVNWTAEAASITDSLATNPTFSSTVLQPRKLAGLARVSRELLDDAPARGAGFSVESIITNSFAKSFAQTEEQGMLVGTGASGQPTGILTIASNGPSVGKQVASNTAITAKEVIEWVYSLGREYRSHPSAAILLSDTALGYIRNAAATAATTQLGYFWQPSGQLGEPDRIMGIPVYCSHYVPAPATTSQGFASGGGICGMIGAFDYCVIGERSGYTLRVLNELYAASDEVGYVATNRVDIKLTNMSAFSYLRGAAS
jgi:HK97 family phage major capsid protein